MALKTRNRDAFVNLVKFPLIAAGLWPRPVTKNPILRKINYVYSTFAKLNYLAFYFGLAIELLRLILRNYSISTIITSFTVFITVSKVSIKVIIYLNNNVIGLLDEVTKKEEGIWNDTDNEVKRIFLKKLTIGKLYEILIWLSSLGTVTATNVSGAIANYNLVKYNEANNASVESHYLYQFWFPANKLEHMITVTTISCMFSYGAMFYNIATNLIVAMLCINSAAHLSVLQHRLRHYIPDDFTEDQMDQAILDLTDLIFQHRYILEFTAHVNKCCKNIIMMEFILTSIDVATGVLNMIKMNLSDLGWLVFYLPMLIIQIYCLAWCANEVNIMSQAVADAAYESRWFLLNRKGKQLTQLIIQRAQQRSLKMTIGPFGPMTMESFLMIMKAAYSYVSIMKN